MERISRVRLPGPVLGQYREFCRYPERVRRHKRESITFEVQEVLKGEGYYGQAQFRLFFSASPGGMQDEGPVLQIFQSKQVADGEH